MSKPTKPYPSFPLTPHVRGGWGKKYKGQQIYIGERDPDKALAEFHRRARAIDGRSPFVVAADAAGDMTVQDLVDRYIFERQADFGAGRLSIGSLHDYGGAGRRMVEAWGGNTLVADLTPDHFTVLFRHLSSLSAHAQARNVQMVRTIFSHAEKANWIDRAPKMGPVFKKPHVGRRQGEPLTPKDARSLINAASGQLMAMVLLGVNCGYGATDCAALPRTAVDLRRNIIVFPRPKMEGRRGAIDRACPLWPETAAALRYVLSERNGDELVFRHGPTGKPWVYDQLGRGGKASHVDAVYRDFQDLCTRARVAPRGFYWLRHLFSTIAAEVERPLATARIMGHRLPGLAEVYVDRVEHGSLELVTKHVRSIVRPRLSMGRR